MYKVVVYWRWDEGKRMADCFWCVPWPDLSSTQFAELVEVARATHILTHGDSTGFTLDEAEILADAGYPEAARMVRDVGYVELRARFNPMKREVFNSEIPLTREDIEHLEPHS